MDDLLRLGFVTVLLVLMLGLLAGFLAVPMMILRKTGVLRIARRTIRGIWRGLVALFRLLRNRKRRKVRRPLAGAFIRLFK